MRFLEFAVSFCFDSIVISKILLDDPVLVVSEAVRFRGDGGLITKR